VASLEKLVSDLIRFPNYPFECSRLGHKVIIRFVGETYSASPAVAEEIAAILLEEAGEYRGHPLAAWLVKAGRKLSAVCRASLH
jgi:hypothetical protein